MKRPIPFFAACIFELAFLGAAVLWSRLFHDSSVSGVQFGVWPVLVGIAAALPPLVFFLWTLHSRLRVFVYHRRLMEALFRPMFGGWSLAQLAIISIVAGVSEEAFFRGAVQGSLAERVGVVVALVLASLAFGAVHLITWTYGIIAAAIGVYLGGLWIWTHNLLTPMVAHAVYDFLALVYLLKIHRPPENDHLELNQDQ